MLIYDPSIRLSVETLSHETILQIRFHNATNPCICAMHIDLETAQTLKDAITEAMMIVWNVEP